MNAYMKWQDNSNFSIRKMNLIGLEIAFSWAAAEGWNPGLYDTGSFYAADPEGFLNSFLR